MTRKILLCDEASREMFQTLTTDAVKCHPAVGELIAKVLELDRGRGLHELTQQLKQNPDKMKQ